jgi:hypothetical protein
MPAADAPSMDPDGQTVKLDVPLLAEQFGLEPA